MDPAHPPPQSRLTVTRTLVLALLLSCAAAAVVGFVSRTPAELRLQEPPAAPGSSGFTDEQVARHGAFRGPLYLAFALGVIVEIAVLVLLRGRPMERIVSWLDAVPGGWPARAAVVAATIAAIAWLVALPLGYVRGYVIQKAWGLSTQDATGWLLDQVKGVGVSVVIAAVAAVAFFAVVRWQPQTWWLWGAGAFTVLTVLLVFLYPVAIAPLFNRFTPLSDDALVQRIEDLGGRAGIDVDEVLVADASRRSTAENAYVAGLGATKQVVVYDTLVANGSVDETLFVVAHELGHESERHVLKNVAISAVGLFLGFGLLAWLVARGSLLSWTGASGVADLRVIPGLLLFATVVGLLSMPVQNAVSRSFEGAADRIAFDLTGDPDPAVGAFHRLALSNIADLRPPPPVVWFFFSHPPIAERIAAAEAFDATKP
jgi:STE24 endopeptidase